MLQSRTTQDNLIDVKELLDGLLIGDGCITTPTGKAYVNPNARYSQVCKHKEFLTHVKYELEQHKFVFGGNNPDHVYEYSEARFPGKTYYSIVSRTNLIFTEYFRRWYVNRKKIVPLDIEITPTVALYWYLGDGTARVNNVSNNKPNYFCDILLASQSFSKEENIFLKEKLENLGMIMYLAKQEDKYLLRISRKSCLDFIDYIGKSPVECYQYKWDRVINGLTRSQAL